MITLDAGEKIKQSIRAPRIVVLLETLVIVLIAVIPFLLYKVFLRDYFGIFSFTQLWYVTLFFYSSWLIACDLFLFLSWVNYYLNAYHITDGRVISVLPMGMFYRSVSAVRLDSIKEVLVDKKSLRIMYVLPGEEEEHVLKIVDIHDPEKIKEMITASQKESMARLQSTLVIEEEQNHLI
jgi:hypothetical protein